MLDFRLRGTYLRIKPLTLFGGGGNHINAIGTSTRMLYVL